MTNVKIETSLLKSALKRLLRPKESLWYLGIDKNGVLVGEKDGTVRVTADVTSDACEVGFVFGPVGEKGRYNTARTLERIVANWKDAYIYFSYDGHALNIKNSVIGSVVSYVLPVENIGHVKESPKADDTKKENVFDPWFTHETVTQIELSDATFSGEAVFFFKSNRGKNNTVRNLVFETADGIYFSVKKRAFDAARSLFESDTAAIKYLLDAEKKNIAAYRLTVTPRGAKFTVPGDTSRDTEPETATVDAVEPIQSIQAEEPTKQPTESVQSFKAVQRAVTGRYTYRGESYRIERWPELYRVGIQFDAAPSPGALETLRSSGLNYSPKLCAWIKRDNAKTAEIISAWQKTE